MIPCTKIRHIQALHLIFGIFFNLFFLTFWACGPESNDSAPRGKIPIEPSELGNSYDYVKITRDFAKNLTADQFIPDHTKDQKFVYGYLFDKVLLTNSTPHASHKGNESSIIKLDERFIQQHGVEGASFKEIVSLEKLSSGYHNDQQLTSFLQQTAQKFPHITSLTSIGKSVQKRDLWLLKISDSPEDNESEPKILFVANMHGDEVVGRELMINLIEHLTENYAADAATRDLVDHSQIYIMPSMNPDGFELRQRFNAAGVDLNRDFPDFTSDPLNEPRGRAPETQALMKLFKDHHFIVSANFHGGEVCFNLPWDTKPNQIESQKFADDSIIRTWARSYANLNPTMIKRSGGSFENGLTYGYEWYEVDGGLQDWSIHYHQSIHGTVELSYVKWPQARELPKFWQENRNSLLNFLNRAREGIHLKVGSDGPSPSAPQISPIHVTIKGSKRRLTYLSDTIHRSTLLSDKETGYKGQTTPVLIEAPGFESIEIAVPSEKFSGEFQQITLRSLNRKSH